MSDHTSPVIIVENGIVGVYTGLLVGISLVISLYLASSQTETNVIAIGTSVAGGLAIASLLSTHEIEHIQHVPDATLLRESKLVSRLQTTGLGKYFIAGAAPIAGIGIVTFPFVLQGVALTQLQATLSAIGLSLLSLFVVGAWVGYQTNQRWYIASMRAGLFGVITVVLSSIVI